MCWNFYQLRNHEELIKRVKIAHTNKDLLQGDSIFVAYTDFRTDEKKNGMLEHSVHFMVASCDNNVLFLVH